MPAKEAEEKSLSRENRIFGRHVSSSEKQQVIFVKAVSERAKKSQEETANSSGELIYLALKGGDRKKEGSLWRDLWETRKIILHPYEGRNMPAPVIRSRSKNRFVNVPLSPRVADIVFDGQAKHLRRLVKMGAVPSAVYDEKGDRVIDGKGVPVNPRDDVRDAAHLIESRDRVPWSRPVDLSIDYDHIAACKLMEMSRKTGQIGGEREFNTLFLEYSEMIGAAGSLLKRWGPESDLHSAEIKSNSKSTELSRLVSAWCISELAWTTVISNISYEEGTPMPIGVDETS